MNSEQPQRRSAKQTRRRPAVVRKLLLEAATKVFKEKGFAQATVEDLVAEAGVSKSVFYRNFRTKDALFQAAILEPFSEFLDDFRPKYRASFEGRWNENALVDLQKSLLRDLDRQLRRHRDALQRLASADAHLDRETANALRGSFDAILQEMRSWGEIESEVWTTPPNLELTDRLIMCMVSGLVTFGPWMLPAGRDQESREEVIDHMARLLLHGMRLSADGIASTANGGSERRSPPSGQARP